MKKFEIVLELPKCDSETQKANPTDKMAPIDLLKQGCHRVPIWWIFFFIQYLQNIMRYAYILEKLLKLQFKAVGVYSLFA